MKQSIAWAVTAAVWIANVGVTVLAVHGLEHPRPYVPGPDVWQPSTEVAKRAVATQAEAAEPSPMEMPAISPRAPH